MTATRIYGIHPVRYALMVPGKITKLWLQSGREDERVKEIVTLAKQQLVDIQATDKHRLTQLAGTDKHQGVVAQSAVNEAMTIADLEENLIVGKQSALILCLDNLQDPHNLGACIRSANAAGCDAVIIPKNRCAAVTPTVHKVSAGGAALTPVLSVSSLAKSLAQLKPYNIQCVGLAGEANQSVYEVDFTQPTAIVMGAEGEGLRDGIRQQCDALVNIPMLGQVASLNVSVATGIVLFEALRQRHHQRINNR